MTAGVVVMGQVVRYRLDESTVVGFEIDPVPGYRPAGAEEIVGQIKEAVAPAVEAAKAVLDKVKQARPDEIELKFGIKVSGTMNWLVAKTATEGNFEITLTWQHKSAADDPPSAAEPLVTGAAQVTTEA